MTVAVVALGVRELLHAASVDRFAGVDIALRVDRVAVQVRELTGLMSRLTQVRDDRAEQPIHRVHDLVPAVDLEKVGLVRVIGEAEVPRRTGGAEPRHAVDSQRHAGARYDRNDAHRQAVRVAALGEDFNAVIRAVANVDQPVVATDDAVRMATVARRKLAERVSQRVVHRSRDAAPLAQVRADRAEHHDAMVTVAIGDVDAAALSRDRVRSRIDPNVGRLVKQRVAHIRQGVAARIAAGIRGRVVAHAFGADLQQLRRAVVRPLLHDAVAVAGDPDVVLVVDEAAVNL